MKYDSGKLLLGLDIAGTFLFGIEGADSAIRGNLDLLGLMVLAFSTALAGGVFRDLLIGAVPPEAIRNWRYAATAFAAALITFFFYRFVEAFPAPLMMLLDAAGLALFAVAGTEKALASKSIHSWRRFSVPSPGWVAAPFAIFSWPTCLASCNPIFTRRPRW
jgi:uncharacterized membrane protein YeiH